MRRVAWAFLLGALMLGACSKFGASGNADNETTPDASTQVVVDAANDAITTETDDSKDGSVPFTDAEVVDASSIVADAGTFAPDATTVDTFERDGLPNGGPLGFQIMPADDPYERTDDCGTVQPLGGCHGNTIRMMNDGTNGAGGGTYMSAPLKVTDREIRWDFDYELIGDGNKPTVNQVQIASIQLTHDCYVYMETKHGELYIGDQYLQDAATNTYMSQEIDVGDLQAGWHHYQLYVDLGAEVAILAVDLVPGDTYLLQSQVVMQVFENARIGVTYQGGDSSVNELYDNVGLTEFP